MRNHSLAMTSPQAVPAPESGPTSSGAPSARPRRRSSKAPADRLSTFFSVKGILETVSEVLWIGLLILVIGFLISKGPQIGSAIDQIGSGGARLAAAPAAEDAQVRELEARVAKYESKLVPLERGYSQLKQRHADLTRAYDQLRKTTVHESYAKLGEHASAGAP